MSKNNSVESSVPVEPKKSRMSDKDKETKIPLQVTLGPLKFSIFIHKRLTILLLILAVICMSIGSVKLFFPSSSFSALLHSAKKTKKILIVFPSTPVSKDLREGLLPNNKDEQIIFDVLLVREDEYISSSETGHRLLDKLKNDDDIIMVVGHETSTVAKYMIENVYENKIFGKEPIPIILPAVTNPDITGMRLHTEDRHILRIPATDAVQVAVISKFLKKSDENKNSTTLIVDDTNLEYSTYIAKSLIYDLPQYVIDSVGIGLSGDGYFANRFLLSNPKTLIFIGMQTQAAMFLNQMNNNKYLIYTDTPESSNRSPKKASSMNENEQLSINIKNPIERPKRFLFTDGVVSTEFNDLIGKLLPSVPIYMTGPIILPPYAREKGASIKSEDLSFKLIGKLTRELITEILKRAQKTRGLDRKGILEVMNQLMTTEENVLLKIGEVSYTFAFNNQGDNKFAEEHLFEVKNGIFFHSNDCGCPKK